MFIIPGPKVCKQYLLWGLRVHKQYRLWAFWRTTGLDGSHAAVRVPVSWVLLSLLLTSGLPLNMTDEHVQEPTSHFLKLRHEAVLLCLAMAKAWPRDTMVGLRFTLATTVSS